MPKYDSMRKTQRNEKIRQLRQLRTELSLREIGALFGISPQRVYQIVKGNKEESKWKR